MRWNFIFCFIKEVWRTLRGWHGGCMVIRNPSSSLLVYCPSARLPSSRSWSQNSSRKPWEEKRDGPATESALLKQPSQSAAQSLLSSQQLQSHTMQTWEAGKCSLTEHHITAPNKTGGQILRRMHTEWQVIVSAIARKEWDSLQPMSYTFPNHIGKRRKSNPKPLVLSEARKQLMIYRLPQVLRLHLKRFRWACSGSSRWLWAVGIAALKAWRGRRLSALVLGGKVYSLETLSFPGGFSGSPTRRPTDIWARWDWASALWPCLTV